MAPSSSFGECLFGGTRRCSTRARSASTRPRCCSSLPPPRLPRRSYPALLLLLAGPLPPAAALVPRRTLVRSWLGAAALVVMPLKSPARAAGDVGTALALVPILVMSAAITAAAKAADAADLQRCDVALKALPKLEREWKSAFDSFSDSISYLTKYQDKNAFLVGITGGFDGPGRPAMGTREAEDPQLARQSAQFGLRNDAWAAVDDGRATLRFLLSQEGSADSDGDDLRDLQTALHAAEHALDGYLERAPPAVLADARRVREIKI